MSEVSSRPEAVRHALAEHQRAMDYLPTASDPS